MSNQDLRSPQLNRRVVSEGQRHYHLQCPRCGVRFEDDGTTLQSACPCGPALLRTIYRRRQLHLGDPADGLFRYRSWLPVHRSLEGSAAPISFQSQGLAAHLGLTKLWVTFTGFWPERGAHTETGTFKENEAYAVCGRLPADSHRILVVASAGNTARAFAHVCSQQRIRNLIVVPELARDQLWFREPLHPCVRLISVRGDYTDAIELAGAICKAPEFVSEGGARNVARRDGMGTTFLSAVTAIGALPDHYFQAIGSGTGAIAAWEAGTRLRADGSWGSHKTRLHVAQNAPFVPVVRSWNARSRTVHVGDEETARRQIRAISAKVLANRTPAYSVEGGLYQAMEHSGGHGYSVTNREAQSAARLFQDTEGVDPSPAASVAVAALVQAVQSGTVGKHDVINLNVTGGGLQRRRQEARHVLQPARTVDGGTPCQDTFVAEVAALFQ